jgi:hypothetical protein
MANALTDVQNTFTSLDANYNLLLAACQTLDQRDAVAAQYTAAQGAYLTCVGKMLADDDAQVIALCAQLNAANAEVTNAVAGMGDMNEVITN